MAHRWHRAVPNRPAGIHPANTWPDRSPRARCAFTWRIHGPLDQRVEQQAARSRHRASGRPGRAGTFGTGGSASAGAGRDRRGAARLGIGGAARRAGAARRGRRTRPRYHRGDGRRPSRRSPRAVPVAPGAGADRHPRRRHLPRGPRTSRPGDLGRLARLVVRRGDGPRHGPADRLRRAAAHLLRRARGARPGARGSAIPPGGAGRVHAADRAAHAQQLPPPGALLLHPAAARRLDRRRGPDPVDEPGRRRLARRARRGVRGGGGRPLAVRPRRLRRRQLRLAGVGRRDGELHRHGPRPRCPPPPSHRRGEAAERRRARRRPRLRQRPDALLDRPGARRARVPARDAGLGGGRRPVPTPCRAGCRGHRPRPGRRPAPRRHRRGRRLDQHGIGRPRARARGRSPRARACGCTSTPRMAALPACRSGTGIASRASTSRTA